MSIRKKILIIIAAAVFSLILVLYLTSESLLLKSYNDLEERNAAQNIERIKLALSSDIDDLRTTNTDWAHWNDTYNFIKDGNKEYIDSNLNSDSFNYLKINFILFLDVDGHIVLTKALDYKTEAFAPADNLVWHLLAGGNLLCHSETDEFSGIVALPEGNFIISSQPILTNSGKGPVRGTLIMGRYLNLEIEKLSKIIQLPIVAQEINESNNFSDFVAIKSSILKDRSISIKSLTKESISSYALLRDVYGKPSIILRVEMPREIYRQGQITIYYFLLFILIFGITFAAVILILLNKAVLSRLANLGLTVSNIGLTGDLSMRVPAEGRDELSRLADDINVMLTRLAQSEGKLRKSEQRYRAIVEDQTELICRFIPDGVLTFVNDAFCRYFNKTRQELMDQKFSRTISKDGERAIEDKVRTLCAENPICSFENSYNTDNGILWQHWTLRVLFNDSVSPVEYQAVGQDITERRRAEEELKIARENLETKVLERTAELEFQNAQMEQFIYTVSHELRSPLITIQGFNGLLLKDVLEGETEKIKTDLKSIADAVTRMDMLLSETLELSQVGRVANPAEDVPFEEMARESLLRISNRAKPSEIEIKISKNMPSVHVDRMRIEEALVNLIENSIKYIGNTANPKIEIGYRGSADEPIFFVRDNGMGIDPSQKSKVFDLFYKVNKNSEGTGVGLAMVKRIIEVHGGRIWIESQLGKGTTVCFTLPPGELGENA
jgi:PAS domain S-box-containing protein